MLPRPATARRRSASLSKKEKEAHGKIIPFRSPKRNRPTNRVECRKAIWAIWLMTVALPVLVSLPSVALPVLVSLPLVSRSRCQPIRCAFPAAAWESSPHEPRERGDVESFRRALDSLRALRTEDRPSPSLARKLSGGSSCQEPSFRRLFTHRTWEQYTGQPTAMRWVQTLTTWDRSTIFRAVVPCVAATVGWATIFLVLHSRSRLWSASRGGLLKARPWITRD